MKYSPPDVSRILPGSRKTGRAWALAIIVLMLGIGLGYLFRGSFSPGTSASLSSGNPAAAAAPSAASQSPFDLTIQPLLARIKNSPDDPGLLADIGNQYYDHRDYGKAVEYYESSLKLKPENVNVRTDMGTAIWYMGNPDGAIREYEIALKFQPDYPETLVNMGIVKWQGKHDGKAAIELWQRLLMLNPYYQDRPKVEQLIQQVRAEGK
jgi:tetratricopeptide (TPR) repeat protein